MGGEDAGQPKRTPAGQLLDRILETDADQWNGMLSGLAVQGQGMTGGVTKDSLLGAVQVGWEGGAGHSQGVGTSRSVS